MRPNTYCPVCYNSGNMFLYTVYPSIPEPCCRFHRWVYQARKRDQKEKVQMQVTIEHITAPKLFQPFKLILNVDTLEELNELDIIFAFHRNSFQERVGELLKLEKAKVK